MTKTILYVAIAAVLISAVIMMTSLYTPSTVFAQGSVPDWVKNNALWWAQGLISEEDFLTSIEWLVNEGIIRLVHGAGDDLSTEVAELQAQVAALEQLTASMTADENNVYFTGVNLRVQDGTGTTPCHVSCNGLGNLIVGYSAPLFHVDRSGSHNFVVGSHHNYPSYGGIVAGYSNMISEPYSSVLGGKDNTASGDYSSVSGGTDNTASGPYSSVSGGASNTANQQYSSVSGGGFNTASWQYSSVSGGSGNTASGAASSVSGGVTNTASGAYTSVSGGSRNTASESTSSVSGGSDNTASGVSSSVSGGILTEASGGGSSVSGGQYSIASGDYSSVSGGQSNTASGDYSSVSGGQSRSATGSDDWVAGTLFEDIDFEIPDFIKELSAIFKL